MGVSSCIESNETRGSMKQKLNLLSRTLSKSCKSASYCCSHGSGVVDSPQPIEREGRSQPFMNSRTIDFLGVAQVSQMLESRLSIVYFPRQGWYGLTEESIDPQRKNFEFSDI
ncbi:unnamed protein product [Cylicocyclus nassatus]|uniref:Uncharacterized protein n=1 Tax=Cylicocyclus nassatus TaxID=53992 RepID=A0AA36H9I5_CYLNA|nr:unnamed protein product [Cylicocyclus nassatus]